MQRKEFTDHLNRYLEIEKFADVCPNGLQVEGKEEIQKVVTAVSANLLTIEKAVEAKADALVVHHGLFWNRDSLPIVESRKKKLAMLLQHHISLLAYHLPLDAHSEVGNNWKAAFDWKWRSLKPFEEIGVEGVFEPLPIESFIQAIEEYYGHRASCALFGKKEVSSAALISGGAWKALSSVTSDCFITGSFDEPAWGMAHERGINFLALGHSATEKIGPRALAQYIETTFKVPTSFLDVPNPF